MEKVIEERLSDKFFKRYTSRAFFIVVVATAMCLLDKIEGEHWCYIAITFIAMNFIQKAVDSSKIDGLAKVLEVIKP